MKVIVIACVLLQLNSCFAYPASASSGAYSYQDSSGRRYGGTYGDPVGFSNNFIGPFGNDFQDPESFFAYFFRNLQNTLQQVMGTYNSPTFMRIRRPFFRRMHQGSRAFATDSESQRLASYAAQKAYELTSIQDQQSSSFFRFPPFRGFPGMMGPDPGMPYGMPDNSAFASSVIGPGFRHQVAAINPPGTAKNIDVMGPIGEPKSGLNYYGVSSSSYAKSANRNGQITSERGGETIVNDNGRITRYKVNN